MGSLKSLCDAGKVRKILALALVCGIIFLSWISIDKDNSMAQTKNYVARSYIKIDGARITRDVGLGGDVNVRSALDLRRSMDDGHFTLIEINVGGQSLYILASDVCVCKALQHPIEIMYKEKYAQPNVDDKNPQLEEMNKNLAAQEPESVYIEVPDRSCYKINNTWR